MHKISPRERLLMTMQRHMPDRVPCVAHLIRWTRYHNGCTCPLHQLHTAEAFGFDPIVYYGMYTAQSISNDYVYAPCGGYNYDATGSFGDLPDVQVEMRVENTKEQVYYQRRFKTPAGELTDVIQWPRPNTGYGDGPNPHRVEPLIKGLKDLEALAFLYPPPRRDMVADIPLWLETIGDRAMMAACDALHGGAWGFESLGIEERLLAAAEDPELLKGVCRVIQAPHLRNLRAMLEQGLKVVFDSWFQAGPSNGWSPATYREMFLPLVREAVALTHEFGALYIYQDDGKMATILEDIAAAGVDVISGLQPPDVGDVILAEAKRKVGGRVTLMGGMDPCYTLEHGTTDNVRQAVCKALEDAAANGGYVLGTAEAVDPRTTPAKNLDAMVQACHEFGKYR